MDINKGCHSKVQLRASKREDYRQVAMQRYHSYSTNQDVQEMSWALFAFSQIISDSELPIPLAGENFNLSSWLFFPP